MVNENPTPPPDESLRVATTDDILFGAWLKADIVTGKAGRLVSMEKRSNASYKLTKSANQLYPISRFYSDISKLLALSKS